MTTTIVIFIFITFLNTVQTIRNVIIVIGTAAIQTFVTFFYLLQLISYGA